MDNDKRPRTKLLPSLPRIIPVSKAYLEKRSRAGLQRLTWGLCPHFPGSNTERVTIRRKNGRRFRLCVKAIGWMWRWVCTNVHVWDARCDISEKTWAVPPPLLITVWKSCEWGLASITVYTGWGFSEHWVVTIWKGACFKSLWRWDYAQRCFEVKGLLGKDVYFHWPSALPRLKTI